MATTHLRSRIPVRMALVGSLVAGGVLLGAPAHAATNDARCVARGTVHLSPGLTLSPTGSEWRYSSNGPTGTVDCVGSVNGHAITGPGTFLDEGVGQGDCNGGTISGHNIYTVPTDAGPQTIRVPVEAEYHGIAGVREPANYPGGFAFAPAEGDCVSTPLTAVDVVVYGFSL